MEEIPFRHSCVVIKATDCTTISSVTRMSADTVGQSLKTMLTRLEQVKVGQLFENDPTTINQVAESLNSVGIALMKDKDTFRPMGDVLQDLAGKWDTLGQKQQSIIAGTIAGKMNARTYSNIWEF
jgi:TP901 family phage tail tape measure protein